MPGKTIYLGENPNDFPWAVPNGHGRVFEDLIERYLKRHVATRDGSIKVYRTKATGDAGRDFEVQFKRKFTLFGVSFPAPLNDIGVVFIECKSTERDRLDDEFIVDASQHGEAEAYAYVLVTNAVLTPYCQYRAQMEWERRGIRFCLIDRRRLADVLHGHNMASDAQRLGVRLPDPDVLPRFEPSQLVVSCQTEQHSSAVGHVAHLFIAMANNGPDSVLSEVSIATDLQWLPREKRYERMIPQGMIETLHLVADRQEFEGPTDLDLNLSVNGRSQRLAVTRPQFALAFEPPFIGDAHRRVARDIRQRAESAQSFVLLSIQGEAGVGKTRTIKEALDPLLHGQYERFIYHFSRNGVSSFQDFERTFGTDDNLDGIRDTASRISTLLKVATQLGVPIIIQFEDLHHADESVINIFKNAVLEPLPCDTPLLLILTGRDDHTFPNEAYYSLLQLVADQGGGHLLCHVIEPLTDHDATTLIRAVVVDMPDPGVDRVRDLGQNNPFVIVEVLQYLLDAHLAQLLSRRTVGILNPEIFAGRKDLPETVEELYNLRLSSLREAAAGPLAHEFLVIASFFGVVIEKDLIRAFFDGEQDGEQAWGLLCSQRFIKDDLETEQSIFAHENLLHHVRRLVRRPEQAQWASSLLLDRPGLSKRLNVLDLGELYFLNQQYPSAFSCFEDIWKRVQRITNFSSEEISRSYFRYLPALFQAGRAIGASETILVKVALANGYMGVHNNPLLVAEDACSASLEMLKALYPGSDQGLRQKVAIAQLRAHALQNMGRTSMALRAMLEVEAVLREHGRRWPEVEFDLFDRLQEYYRKINHEEMAHFYGRLARNSLDRAGDEKLLASHLITCSVVGLFTGGREARQRAREAHRVARRVGVQRLIVYTRLTELVAETLYAEQDVSILRDVAEEARTMLRDAVLANFSDSIMRLELLLGTIALHCCEEPAERHVRAGLYVRSGQANSIRYGHGLFDWAFDNLAAVIAIEDPRGTDDVVRARFESCLARLRNRGLTFLGAEDGTYPNAFAISNIVRFFGQLQESTGLALVQSSFSAYDNRFAQDDPATHDLVRRAVRGLPIFWPKRSRVQMLRYPAKTGYFTPVF